ncbi:MAG: SDR family oxidoreductase [Hyphomicrobium sp.]
MSGETVVVTGASGFIAKYIAAELLKRGFAVRGTLRTPSKADSVARAIARAGASTAQLSFVAADLLSDAGWDDAMRGAAFVAHTASPFPIEQPNDGDALIRPARDGTLRVFGAAHRAGVKRIVLTSSTVAVMYPAAFAPGHVFSERDMTDDTRAELTPYIRSKTMAEKAAWDFGQRVASAPELAVINPGFVQGPALDDDLSTSHELYRLIARGIYPAAPRIRFPVCDVRDVAAAHVEALIRPQAAGERFIVAEGETGLFALGEALARECPDLKSKVPKFQLPDLAVRGLAIFDKRLRTVLPELGRNKMCTSAKAKDVLGLTLRDGDAAISDAIRSLRALGLI